MKKVIKILIGNLVCVSSLLSNVWAQNDTNHTSDSFAVNNLSDTLTTKKANKYPPYQRQIKLLFDIGNFGMNFVDKTRSDIEFAVDYHYINNWYGVAETGFANGKIDYPNLKYISNSYFLRLGIDKCLLKPISERDLDVVFFGFRYGMAIGSRKEATYIVPSLFGSSKEGNMPAQDFMVHWGEMTGGMRVEMYKNIYAGWNFRAKFLLNGKIFDNKISPNYITGYGKADLGTSFGFNVYLGYAIRWKTKND
jgi:hypothetical protein